MADNALAIWLPLLSQLCAMVSTILLMAAATNFCRWLARAYRAPSGENPADATDSAPAAPV